MGQSISAGDFEEYPVGTQALIRVVYGEIKVGDHPNTAERQVASYGPQHGWFEWRPSHSERLVIFAVSDSEVDVQYNDGFSVSLFGFPILDVDSQAPNIPDARQQTTRIPAEGVVEQNGDQTTNLDPQNSQISTFTAANNEVWVLTGFTFSYVGETANIEVVIRSEGQASEYGFARKASAASGDTYRYDSGKWFVDGSSAWDNSRDAILDGHRIDDTNGLEVVFKNEDAAGGTTITNDRTIRAVFQVIRA